MNGITLKRIKEDFDDIADMIISFDDNQMVILKSKEELSDFIKCKTSLEADIVLDELQYMYKNRMISESYLKGDEWRKMKFNEYILLKKKTISIMLEAEQDREDDKQIESINRELDECDTNGSKKAYLIKKLKSLEGSRYNGNKKIIKKDNVYVFVKRELKRLNNLSDGYRNKTQVDLIPQPETFLDFSDNTASEKIVFLHELGILDYLMQKEPFNTSTNKLAEIVSAFTGIPQKTAQSYLNPICSKTAAQKNNPLTTNNIKKVSEKLLKIGYTK